jgi:hypothetical protein
MTAITIIHIERTGTHEQDSFVFDAKGLRAAQNAAYEFVGGPQSKAQRGLRSAGGVFKQEPAEMRLYCFCGSAGLPRDEARNVGNVVF